MLENQRNTSMFSAIRQAHFKDKLGRFGHLLRYVITEQHESNYKMLTLCLFPFFLTLKKHCFMIHDIHDRYFFLH